MKRQISDLRAYEKIIGNFKKNKKGITVADVAANTGLPLPRVAELVPLAADEFSARLEVTESGEILYSFPGGFKSRYRGLGPALKRAFSAASRLLSAALKLLFKCWIMVMLLGYFVLFLAIALASLLISVSANSRDNRSSRGGSFAAASMFNLIIRLWLYSELFGSGRTDWAGRRRTEKKRPLHRAIFSFVFGEEDPNRDRETQEKKAFISYIRIRRGIISLPELMILTGQNPQQAEHLIISLCAEFGGSPEVTEDGTVVYRFTEILRSGEKNAIEELTAGIKTAPANASVSPLFKKLKTFSSNPGKMNFWFGLINAVNLFFGSYFLYQSMTTGRIYTTEMIQSSGIYGIVYYFLISAGIDPLPLIQIGLGLVPLIFSVFFWLIPAIRSWLLKKENDSIRLSNFRGLSFSRIWARPEEIKSGELNGSSAESQPKDIKNARDRIIKEMASYSTPEISTDEKQNEVYTFPELRREKDALEKYRQSIDPGSFNTGKTVFDSEK